MTEQTLVYASVPPPPPLSVFLFPFLRPSFPFSPSSRRANQAVQAASKQHRLTLAALFPPRQTICGRTLAQTRARLDALLLNQHRNNNNNNRRPRALERAAYKSILCPRTLAAALAFAAAHNLNVDNVAARLASVGPGDLFPQLLAHTELLNPMYGLDAVFWTDMCRLVCTALADAMGCLQRRGVLVRHEHGGEGGQVQVHWAWCAETMALWTAGAGGEERMVEDVDQMVYATTTAAERAAMGLEELVSSLFCLSIIRSTQQLLTTTPLALSIRPPVSTNSEPFLTTSPSTTPQPSYKRPARLPWSPSWRR